MFQNCLFKRAIFATMIEMNAKKVLFIGLVWPEPNSSAAGKRIIQLVSFFVDAGFQVIFASAASRSEYSFELNTMGVIERQIRLNDPGFDLFVADIKPGIVVFDRFVTEEQYGWRVASICPRTIRVLDTEDLHCLREARKCTTGNGKEMPADAIFNHLAKREIASILRSDLSLIISAAEMTVLTNQFRIDPSLLYELPFLENGLSCALQRRWKSFEQREGFVFIGNFLHEPNWHTVKVLKTEIWPVLRTVLPGIKLHIYGAYCSQKVNELHQPKESFLVHGRTPDAQQALESHRVLLAPIRFGAGLKGKFIDAMCSGTPCVTTSLGAEAMSRGLEWNGAVADTNTEIIRQAAALYQCKEKWLNAQSAGVRLINEVYDQRLHIPSFLEQLARLEADLTAHRNHNFIGQILNYDTAGSHKYMSLWIEEKNRPSLDSGIPKTKDF